VPGGGGIVPVSRAEGLARRWWAGELGAAGRLLDGALAPAEAAYRLATGLRNRRYDGGRAVVHRVDAPVISVGNVGVGGTGKTPVAHWVARRVQEMGRSPAILHGGYAADEPALHRRWAPEIPVVVDRDRVAGARQALAAGADVLVLDDGFQHRRLARTLDVVLVSAEGWTPSPRLLPRGPWREPPSALKRADVVVVTRKSASAGTGLEAAAGVAAAAGQEAVRVHLRPSGWRAPAEGDGGHGTVPAPTGPVLLVSGIAEPGAFRSNATEAGAQVAAAMAFGDHHEYAAGDVARIREAAAGRTVVTTEKDWVKLRPLLTGVEVRLLVQEVEVEWGLEHLLGAVRDALG
jgi:tetraacyldisaccharide 4'-kinase